MRIEVSGGGSRTIEVLIALVLLCAVSYVLARVVLARRRGDDVRHAAASAVMAVGPPAFLAVFGLLALSVILAFFGILVILVLINGLAEMTGSDAPSPHLPVVFFVGLALVLLTVVGPVAWALVRAVRSIRNRSPPGARGSGA